LGVGVEVFLDVKVVVVVALVGVVVVALRHGTIGCVVPAASIVSKFRSRRSFHTVDLNREATM
jgi:hypothetical protein